MSERRPGLTIYDCKIEPLTEMGPDDKAIVFHDDGSVTIQVPIRVTPLSEPHDHIVEHVTAYRTPAAEQR